MNPVVLDVPRSLFARVFAACLLTLLTVALAGQADARVPTPASSTCSADHWIAAWTAAPSDSLTLGDPNLDPALVLGAQSFRMMVTPHHGGSQIRVHLTNRFGNSAVDFQHVTVGIQATGATVQAGSMRAVTFGGRASVEVPVGQDVVSDPVALAITAFQPVAISFFMPAGTVLPTEHFNANQTSYVTPPLSGDHVAEVSGGAFSQKITSWYWVDGLDVMAAPRVSTVVAFGDSITDGFVTDTPTLVPASTVQVDKNVRYPDFLQRRLSAAHLPLVTVDEGISGNRVLQPGIIPQFGPSGLSRIGNDAVNVPGVTNAIILEGINDLGQPPWPTAAQMEQGYRTLIDALHARHIRVLLGTLMPSGNALTDGPATAPGIEATRQQINEWIRTQRYSDGVVDFDKAMRSPTDPAVLNPAYADGDNLHPNPTGYQAMADAVPLDQLVSGCGVAGSGAPSAPNGGGSTLTQVLASVTALTKTQGLGDNDTTFAQGSAVLATILHSVGALL